ncbi:UNVERIFIED_CONTAM: hypothetical protein Sindi_1260000, partial [Sesamum indicum]
MGLKLYRYDMQVVGYATVQAGRDLDVVRRRCGKSALSALLVFYSYNVCTKWAFFSGHDGGLQEPALGCSRGVLRVPEGLENLTGSVGLGWPTLGANTAERLCVTRKVAPWAARYQGQHLSCEWMIEVSIPKPRDPTYDMRYRVLAVHGGPLAKDERSWDDAAL